MSYRYQTNKTKEPKSFLRLATTNLKIEPGFESIFHGSCEVYSYGGQSPWNPRSANGWHSHGQPRGI